DGYGGATTTKSAMLEVLNSTRLAYYEAFDNADIVMKAVLSSQVIEFTNENFKDLFASTLTVETSVDLTLYVNSSNQNVSFLFETEEGFGGLIQGVITLESDFETIVNIKVYQQTETWGARIQNNETFFDSYVGKKFSPTISFVAE